MLFMSQEHVDAMNELLERSADVREACAATPTGPAGRVLAYRLTDGPEGSTVRWSITFTDTVRFALEEHPSPDVTFVGDWSRMIRAARASRAGEPLDPGVEVVGDLEVMAAVGPAFAAAQAVATLPVEFPPTPD